MQGKCERASLSTSHFLIALAKSSCTSSDFSFVPEDQIAACYTIITLIVMKWNGRTRRKWMMWFISGHVAWVLPFPLVISCLITVGVLVHLVPTCRHLSPPIISLCSSYRFLTWFVPFPDLLMRISSHQCHIVTFVDLSPTRVWHSF